MHGLEPVVGVRATVAAVWHADGRSGGAVEDRSMTTSPHAARPGDAIDVVHVTADRLLWRFSDDGPVYRYGSGNTSAVDPFPCYSHDLALVTKMAEHCRAAWPLDASLTIHVGAFEDTHRTNGWSTYDYQHDEDAGKWVIGDRHVWLSGKRIPPHPAVTRYVVAHEYGHQVEWSITRARGLDVGDLAAEYREVRGLDDPGGYGGGTWHATPAEVFACDFRVLIAEVEVEYWPHDGVRRPAGRKLRRWWDRQRSLVAEAEAA